MRCHFHRVRKKKPGGRAKPGAAWHRSGLCCHSAPGCYGRIQKCKGCNPQPVGQGRAVGDYTGSPPSLKTPPPAPRYFTHPCDPPCPAGFVSLSPVTFIRLIPSLQGTRAFHWQPCPHTTAHRHLGVPAGGAARAEQGAGQGAAAWGSPFPGAPTRGRGVACPRGACPNVRCQLRGRGAEVGPPSPAWGPAWDTQRCLQRDRGEARAGTGRSSDSDDGEGGGPQGAARR